MSAATPNRDQIEYWNGPRGEFWVTHKELRDRELAFFGDAAVEAAMPARGERVVDVGCGCGASSMSLADRVGVTGSVFGVDVSKPMLALARQEAAHLGHVRFELADASTYAFDGDASLLFSRFGVMFFDDPPAAFKNLRSALSSSGRLAFVCWRSLTANDWMRVAFDAIRPLITPVNPLPPPGAPGPLAFADADRVRSILEHAGFRDVAFAELDHPMPLGGNAGLDAAAADALTVGPSARLLAGATDGDRARALVAARAALEPYAQGDRVELRGAAWLVTARAG